ncbi:MAG TPA: polysaccharide deacetylase family protein [Candidatus Acidoferrum sp.]|jgi:peptidoglycan/xylan/chitin deacetylase (PgdA/CDA1 family)
MSQTERKFLMTTSWDDGHPLDMRVADLLAKHGLTGTFYVPQSGPRAVMDTSQLRNLSETFEIGGHTLEHVAIDRLSDRDAGEQLSGSREWIEQLTGKSCRVFCFPGGRFRKRQLKLVRRAGYEAARTVEFLSTANPRLVDDLCLMPTTIQAYPHGPLAYARNALKRFPASTLINLPRSLRTSGWISLAKHLFLQTMERGGVFHLWGHSWEIEQEHQWQQLEVILALMGSCSDKVNSLTNGELGAYAA